MLGNEESKYEVYRIIERLERLVDGSWRMPIARKYLVKEADFFELTRELRQRLPAELEEARQLINRSQEMIEEAQRKADEINARAKEMARRLVDEHEITLKARDEAAQIVQEARDQAKEIKRGAMEYAYRLLERVAEKVQAIADAAGRAKEQLETRLVEEDQVQAPDDEADDEAAEPSEDEA